MSDTVEQKDSNVTEPIKKKSKAGKVFKIGGVSILLVIFAVLVINSLLVMFNDDYYTTFGNYRLFAIVSDSMEPTIPTGSMIVDSKPENPADIKRALLLLLNTTTDRKRCLSRTASSRSKPKTA